MFVQFLFVQSCKHLIFYDTLYWIRKHYVNLYIKMGYLYVLNIVAYWISVQIINTHTWLSLALLTKRKDKPNYTMFPNYRCICFCFPFWFLHKVYFAARTPQPCEQLSCVLCLGSLAWEIGFLRIASMLLWSLIFIQTLKVPCCLHSSLVFPIALNHGSHFSFVWLNCLPF